MNQSRSAQSDLLIRGRACRMPLVWRWSARRPELRHKLALHLLQEKSTSPGTGRCACWRQWLSCAQSSPRTSVPWSIVARCPRGAWLAPVQDKSADTQVTQSQGAQPRQSYELDRRTGARSGMITTVTLIPMLVSSTVPGPKSAWCELRKSTCRFDLEVNLASLTAAMS